MMVIGILISTSVYAEEEVDVNIPGFDIVIGGESIDNQHNKYPMIVYNDITYFPMTWNFSRALGEFCFGVGMIAKASLYFEIHCRCVENVYGRESDIVYNSFNLVGCFLINAGLPGKARHYCLKALAFSITEKELW